MSAHTQGPTCLACGKRLRPYRYRIGGPRKTDFAKPSQQWGDYGDNLFCGLTCGYHYALAVGSRLAIAADRARAAIAKAEGK